MVECTGERYMPEFCGDWALEHMHRYLLACELADGKEVLDIACGDGYGSNMLARRAQSVVGVDIDAATIDRARQKYKADNLSFRHGSATAIPMEADAVDLVVSFETIEHLQEHDAMMKEILRVLRPNGVLLMSSPDKYEYSDLREFNNEFHVRELYFKEFDALLERYFAHHICFGQRVVFGSLIVPEEKNSFCSWQYGNDNPPVPGVAHAVYHLGLASNGDVPVLPGGILSAPMESSDCANFLRGSLESHIAALEQHIREKDAHIATLERNCTSLSEELHQCRQGLESAHAALQSLLQSNSWRLTAPLRALAKMLGKAPGKIS